MEHFIRDKTAKMTDQERRKFVIQAWSTSSLVFSLIVLMTIFNDGVFGVDKLVVAGTVVMVVSPMLFAFFKAHSRAG
ncbi:hypothetical protein [Pseudomonas graminis]|jgi:hypothetical protein|uniref:hypothetical protein n=1 Tax=Pseudomonas graminis TaxID=158627 RepID=UPI0015592024|nr:hypothetical protein [Pseudomonas graminis]